MSLYLDASALVKRYQRESGSDELIAAMATAQFWVTSRLAYPETLAAVTRTLGGEAPGPARFREEWDEFRVVEVSAALADAAASLAIADALGTLDAIHLASALRLGDERLVFATWDRVLHAAAERHGLRVLPERL